LRAQFLQSITSIFLFSNLKLSCIFASRFSKIIKENYDTASP
jgi:hypothetical protein